MNAQIKKLTQAFPAFRLRLADNKRWALMAGVGLAVAATAIIVSVLWTGNRGYVSLYGRQENLPVSQIVTVLDGEKLSYRIDPQSGQILVPEDELSKTRMTLAAKGVQAILPSGYELMDKDEVLGSSQFVQNVRYKRSLEGELAQSIMSLDAVESARVHLALNEESSFVVSDVPQNSASVVVRLHYGAKLNMDQVNAIVHLVSGSIPGLHASKVSVVDQAGNLLTDGIGAGEAVSAATRKRDQILKDIQDKTRASVANVLDSLVGTGNYRVSVMPDLDLSTIDETQEHYGENQPRRERAGQRHQSGGDGRARFAQQPSAGCGESDDQRHGRKSLAGSVIQTQRKQARLLLRPQRPAYSASRLCGETTQRGGGAQSKRSGAEKLEAGADHTAHRVAEQCRRY